MINQCKALNEMIGGGQRPFAHSLWLDCYNRTAILGCSTTILTGYDSRNMHFVIVEL